jgi:hypothetical protein
VVAICTFAAALVLFGAAIGVIGVVSLGIHRDERAQSLTSGYC